MTRTATIALCGLLVLTLSALAFDSAAADGGSATAKVGKAAKAAYRGGVNVADRAEGLFSGCLRTCFSLCNPCLDLVKGCAGYAVLPIEVPFSFVEKQAYSYLGKGKAKPAGKKKQQ
jgi:hypothetical protein